MQKKRDIFWITLGQPEDGKGKNFKQVQKHVKSILKSLGRKAKERGWSYSIYGTISNVHISGINDFEVFGFELLPEVCRYHVHLLMIAEPGSTIADDEIRDKWKFGTRREICVKYGKGPKGIYDLEHLFWYIQQNHDKSTRGSWVIRHCPSKSRARRDEVMQEIREGYANLGTHTEADTIQQSKAAQGLTND